jgi:hypothetical protein
MLTPYLVSRLDLRQHVSFVEQKPKRGPWMRKL